MLPANENLKIIFRSMWNIPQSSSNWNVFCHLLLPAHDLQWVSWATVVNTGINCSGLWCICSSRQANCKWINWVFIHELHSYWDRLQLPWKSNGSLLSHHLCLLLHWQHACTRRLGWLGPWHFQRQVRKFLTSLYIDLMIKHWSISTCWQSSESASKIQANTIRKK